ERLRTAIKNPARSRHILKRAVSPVVKQPAGISAIRLRRAIRFVRSIQTAKHIMLRRPPDVVAYKKVQQSVAVIIKPQRRRAEPGAPEQAARFRRIHKRARTRIAK